MYWHSSRAMVTNRLYQLLDTQQEALLDFLLAEPEHPPLAPCPLPIIGGRENRVRVSTALAITVHQVYRDEWERKPPTMEYLRKLDRRPRDEIYYPEVGDQIFRINKQLDIPLPRPRTRSPSPEVAGGPYQSESEEARD